MWIAAATVTDRRVVLLLSGISTSVSSAPSRRFHEPWKLNNNTLLLPLERTHVHRHGGNWRLCLGTVEGKTP